MIKPVQPIIPLNNDRKPKQQTINKPKANSNFSFILNEQIALCKSSN